MLDPILYICLAVFIGAAVIALLVKLLNDIYHFRRKLDYLNCEVGRTAGSERRYWMKKRRELWLSLIPFYKFFRRR